MRREVRPCNSIGILSSESRMSSGKKSSSKRKKVTGKEPVVDPEVEPPPAKRVRKKEISKQTRSGDDEDVVAPTDARGALPC